MVWEYRNRPISALPVIVYGAGIGGRQVLGALLDDPSSPYYPVALLDDDPEKQNLRIRHLRVAGRGTDLGRMAAVTGATVVIIAIPSASSELIREVTQRAGEVGLSVLTLPPVSQLFSPTIRIGDIRPVTNEDLLGRRAIDTRVEEIAGYLQGRRVLVTGAGGSIGSELCRQITRFAPADLIMLDRDESGLHQVQLSIEGRALLDSRSLVVCDIRDESALAAVFNEHHPEVVFHAAALKHLPLLQMWPAEAVKTNVFGTQNVINAAKRVKVAKFINISTDKAANPTSVLGYSKRVAEQLTATAGIDGNGTYLSVRFGNVLGSRGSVLTAFRHQIEVGGPVTVTDPEVTRYFMTTEEAVQLVIQAGAIGDNGEVLVFDMGEPVRIADVARQLVALATQPVEIVYTGLRAGEKLHEDRLGAGEVDLRPHHPLISQVTVPGITIAEVSSALARSDGAGVVTGLRLLCERTTTRSRAERLAGTRAFASRPESVA
jgi:FlaA1/EpsC-like NDP-sugar epimerase